jgi:hypothetical protein
MLYKNRYFMKAMGLSFALFATFIAYSQDTHSAKKKIASIDKPVQQLVRLQPGVFEYDHKATGRHYGFSVEDIEAVFPELVKTSTQTYMFGKNTYRTRQVKTVDMESLIPILVASVKEQQVQLEQLKQELQVLKSKPVAGIK